VPTHVEQAVEAKIAGPTAVPVESREVLRLRELGGIYDRQDARKAQRDSERGSTTAGTPTPEPPNHTPTISGTTRAARTARSGTADAIDPLTEYLEQLHPTPDSASPLTPTNTNDQLPANETTIQEHQDPSLAASDNEGSQQLLMMQPIPGVHFPAAALQDSSALGVQFNAAKHYGASTEQWTHLVYAHSGRREREHNTVISSPASRGARGRITAATPKGARGRVPTTKGRTSEPPQFRPSEPELDIFEQYEAQRQLKSKYKRDRFSLPPTVRPEDDVSIDEQPYPHEQPQDPQARQPTPPLTADSKKSTKSTAGTVQSQRVVDANAHWNSSTPPDENTNYEAIVLIPESEFTSLAVPSRTVPSGGQRLWELSGAALGVGQGVRERKVIFAVPDDHPAWTS